MSGGVVRGAEPLLRVDGLSVDFAGESGVVHAVTDVSLSVDEGEIVAIVGESGSGKSVTAMSILRLLREPPARTVAGSIRFRGQDVRALRAGALRSLRGGPVGMIFQDPMTTLNPVVTVGDQIAEAVRLHQPSVGRREARRRAVELLERVGVPHAEHRARQYPYEFSGGMRQRAMIAMAMANDPDLVIADEPTTALDVTIQAQVLELLERGREETGAAAILITHDLGVVAEMADRVVVMYAGRVVETAGVHGLFAEPQHPYTAGLLASLPRMDDEADNALTPIPGNPPDMSALVTGCPFAPRCPLARDRCHQERPPLVEVAPGRHSACHFHHELVGRDPRALFTGLSAEEVLAADTDDLSPVPPSRGEVPA